MGKIVELAFGRRQLSVELPDKAEPTIIRKVPLAKLVDPHGAVRQALAEPVAAAPYSELVKNRRSACILICDITRPVPNRLFLRPLVEGLMTAGMPAERSAS